MLKLCRGLAASGLLTVGMVVVVNAQVPSAGGVVLSTTGQPVVRASITAVQPDVSAREFTARTDGQGQWIMLGMTGGPWVIRATADGFLDEEINIEVRVNTPPITFVLEALNFLPPGSLPADILLRVDAASALRNEGDFEAATAAFEELRAALPELTMLNMVLGGIYRQRAALENNASAQQALLLEALDAYGAIPETAAGRSRARLQIGSTQMEAGDIAAATETFQAIIVNQPDTPEAREAGTLLRALVP